MISIEDVLKLKEAGFSADEICNLRGVLEDPAQPVDAEPEDREPTPDKQAEILDAISSLTKAVQAANIRAGSGSAPEVETAEDILKNMFK